LTPALLTDETSAGLGRDHPFAFRALGRLQGEVGLHGADCFGESDPGTGAAHQHPPAGDGLSSDSETQRNVAVMRLTSGN
jgi:hypothetical protein